MASRWNIWRLLCIFLCVCSAKVEHTADVINTSEFSFPLLDIVSKSNKKGQLQISRLITALTLCYIIDNISKYTNIHLLYPICF